MDKFYSWMPDWAQNALKTRTCSQCSTKYSKADIVAIGIRDIDEGTSLYIEHKCSSCGFRALTTFGKHKETTLEELCYTLLEHIKKRKLAQKSCLFDVYHNPKPFGDDEVKKFIAFINDSKTHEEVMREIGAMPPDQSNDVS